MLLYGSEVWGFQDITQIEILYRKFIKCLLRVNSATPNVMIYGETSTYPVEIHIVTRMIVFYMRIVNGKQSKLSAMMLNLLKKKTLLDESFESKWISLVQNQLEHLGMNNIWIYSGNGLRTDHVKAMVKLRLKDNFKQKWFEDMGVHEFCDIYKVLKLEWGFEKYLTALSPFHRIALAKWRCRSNYLPISKNRWVIDDSILCPFCHNDDYIGDEIHYLLKCNFFQEERSRYIGNIGDGNDQQNYIRIFHSNDIEVVKKLSCFVHYIMSIFEQSDKWDISLNSSGYSLFDYE